MRLFVVVPAEHTCRRPRVDSNLRWCGTIPDSTRVADLGCCGVVRRDASETLSAGGKPISRAFPAVLGSLNPKTLTLSPNPNPKP